jgi:hypothetical protein
MRKLMNRVLFVLPFRLILNYISYEYKIGGSLTGNRIIYGIPGSRIAG